MRSVSPIKNLTHINELKKYFKTTNMRDYILFSISINLPYSINTIIHFKVKDVIDEELVSFPVQSWTVQLPSALKGEIEQFVDSMNLKPDDYLFQSQKTNQPLTRQQVYRIINDGVKKSGIEGHYGVYSLKKTFAYHTYKQGIDISSLQRLLGHQSKYETYRFIEIEPVAQSIIQLNL